MKRAYLRPAMESPRLSLRILNEKLAIARLEATDDIPAWATLSTFASITRTADELTIVCIEAELPALNAKVDRGWRAFQVEGILEFHLTGILAAIAEPLAAARISIFAISTFYSDYVLVKEGSLADAIEALKKAGHALVTSE